MATKWRYTDATESFRLKSRLHLPQSCETSIRIIGDFLDASIQISCLKNITKIYKLETIVHVARPHADKVAAKVIISTVEEGETTLKLRNQR